MADNAGLIPVLRGNSRLNDRRRRFGLLCFSGSPHRGPGGDRQGVGGRRQDNRVYIRMSAAYAELLIDHRYKWWYESASERHLDHRRM